MEPFDVNDPPETFDGFVNSIKSLVREHEVGEEEYYPDALFTVDKFHLGYMIDVDELSEELEVPPVVVLNSRCTEHLSEGNIKWYAYAFYIYSDDGDEYMGLLAGTKHKTGFWMAPIYTDYGLQYISDWEPVDPTENFPNVIVPLRQAIVNQG